MGLQINEYANTRIAATVTGDDFLDFDATDDSGINYFSAKIAVDEFMTYVNDQALTLYLADGTLTGNRTITGLGNEIKLLGGDQVVEMNNLIDDYGFHVNDNASVTKASLFYDQSTTSGAFSVSDSLGEFFTVNDGVVNTNIGYSIGNQLWLSSRGTSNSLFIGAGAGQSSDFGDNFNIGIGFNALSNVTAAGVGIAIGFQAGSGLVSQDRQFIMGNYIGSSSTGNGNVLIGNLSAANDIGGENVIIGGSTAGSGAGTGSNELVMIGARTSATGNFNSSIAIGAYAQIDRNNQFVAGQQGSGNSVAEVVIGSGSTQASGFSGSVTYRNTDVADGVLNQSSNYRLQFACSRGTGDQVGGDQIWFACPAGASGSTRNPIVEAMRLKAAGQFGIGLNTPLSRLHVRGLAGDTNSFIAETNGGTSVFETRNDGNIVLPNIPTSDAGLPSGALWSDAGTIKITP